VLHVDWRDGYWMVRAGDEPALPALLHRRGPTRSPPSLQPGIFHLGRRFRLPSGRLRPPAPGERSRRDALGAPRRRRAGLVEGADAPALLAVRVRPGRPTRRSRCRPRRWCCSTSSRGVAAGPLGTLPGLAVLILRRSGDGAAGAGSGGLLAQNLPRGMPPDGALLRSTTRASRVPRPSRRRSPRSSRRRDGPGTRMILDCG